MTTLTFDSHAQARVPRRARGEPARSNHRPRPVALAPAAAISAPLPAPPPARRRAGTLALVGVIAALHGAAIVSLSGERPHPVRAAPQPITIALVTPRVEPPPPPPPPKPQVQPPRAKALTPLPRPAAPPAAPTAPSTPVVAADTPMAAASHDTVQVATAPAAAPMPAVPAPAEKVTEPRGYAGYLNNPPPVYPPAAQKRGLEGQVVLKVHVLPSGHPDNVTVARSSGHAILDDAALKAVTQWTFEPARRGQAAIDGWVQVPLNFKI